MRIGAKLPNSGPLPLELGIPSMAAALERAGFDSLWVSDHIVMPETIESRYPFAADGRATWPTDTPYIDALIALALAAAATERVRLGTAALVLPQRNPVELAKQAASIDVASGGRLELGVGAGWLAEEFAALNVPFAKRGARMDEWIAILRECWTGRTNARSSEFYELPEGTQCLPTPRGIPVLIGGHSPAALRRATRQRRLARPAGRGQARPGGAAASTAAVVAAHRRLAGPRGPGRGAPARSSRPRASAR